MVIIVIASVLVPWSTVAQAIVNIVEGKGFTLTAMPQTVQMVATETVHVSVTVHRSSSYATYNLNCNPSSSAIQCLLYPPYGVANPDFSSTLTITTVNAPVGQYSISVRAIEAVEFQIVTVTINVVSTQTTTVTSTTIPTTSTASSTSSVNTMGITFLDVTPTGRLSEEQYGYVLARGGLDPNVKSLKVQLPHDDTAVFHAGIQEWYDKSITFTQKYGGSTLNDAYPITFTTEGVDSTGDENIRIIYTSPVCGQSSGAFACWIPNNNGIAGLWTGGTIYFDTYYRDVLQGDATRSRQDIIRTETTHEFGHVLGLGDFYHSPTCFGYTSSIMCGSNPLSTIDEYAVIVKWHQIQANPPQSLYGILVLPSNMPNVPLTSATTTATINFQNGGFESGSLAPWNPSGISGGASIDISTVQAHSGHHSVLLSAPTVGIVGLTQTFTPITLPVIFSAYFYNVQYPSVCDHPYTQWGLRDTSGTWFEAGFDAIGVTWAGAIGWVQNTGYYTAPNQWVKISVEVYPDHYTFYVNDNYVLLTGTGVYTGIDEVQLFASCSAVVYFDDVQFTPITTSIMAPIIEAWDRFWRGIWCLFGYCS